MQVNKVCPNCKSTNLTAFVNMRRAYTTFTIDDDGVVWYAGWGEDVDDEVDYIQCDDCSTQFQAREEG